MAIEFKKQSYAGHFPEIWRGEAKILPGGFSPKKEIQPGTVLRRAVPLCVDFDELSAAICKTVKVLAGGTTTKPRIPKGHYFSVGDSVTKHGDYSKLVVITGIDKSNTEYDTLTLQSAYTGLAENDVLVEGAYTGLAENDVLVEGASNGEGENDVLVEGASNGEGEKATIAPAYEPNMIIGAEKNWDGKGLLTIDAAYDAVVLIPSLEDTPMLPEWLNGVCLKNNPNILYIKQ